MARTSRQKTGYHASFYEKRKKPKNILRGCGGAAQKRLTGDRLDRELTRVLKKKSVKDGLIRQA